MAENQANTSKSSSVTIEYQGWSDKTANMVAKNKKIETVKEKILSILIIMKTRITVKLFLQRLEF